MEVQSVIEISEKKLSLPKLAPIDEKSYSKRPQTLLPLTESKKVLQKHSNVVEVKSSSEDKDRRSVSSNAESILEVDSSLETDSDECAYMKLVAKKKCNFVRAQEATNEKYEIGTFKDKLDETTSEKFDEPSTSFTSKRLLKRKRPNIARTETSSSSSEEEISDRKLFYLKSPVARLSKRETRSSARLLESFKKVVDKERVEKLEVLARSLRPQERISYNECLIPSSDESSMDYDEYNLKKFHY